MQMFQKFGNEVILVYNPAANEEVQVGENLLIMDEVRKKGIIVQVFEQNLVDLPGILEELIRRESLTHLKLEEHAPAEYVKYAFDVKNMKFARAKIHKQVIGDEIADWTGWIPDRSSKVTSIKDEWLLDKLKVAKKYYNHPIFLGKTAHTSSDFVISAYNLQGISLVIGKKGSGKSHITKAMLLGLIDLGAIGLVFDINDEYPPMRMLQSGKPSRYADKLIALDPGNNLKFTPDYVGKDVFTDVLVEAMRLSDASTLEFMNIWENLQTNNQLTLANLCAAADNVRHASVRLALTRRLETVKNTGLFTDDPSEAMILETQMEKIKGGGALIVNLKAKDVVTINLVVQTLLSKIQSVLEEGKIHPIFFLAEEAHTYFRGTNWIDAVTRMRHLGTYQIYVTNTPTQIRDLVIRQTDNLFAFYLSEQEDIAHVSPATKIEQETLRKIVTALPMRRCLAIGIATADYPFVIDVTGLPVKAAGETKRFFTEP